MSDSRTIRIYLDEKTLGRVLEGKHNFFGIVIHSLTSAGFEVDLQLDTPEELEKSAGFAGYSLFYRRPPSHDRALDVRPAYIRPFWRIEAAAHRKDYVVAGKKFNPEKIDGPAARKFHNYWRKRLTGELATPQGGDRVLVALQGPLLEAEPGQAATQIQMARETLSHDPYRKVVVRPQATATYTAEEVAALEELEQHPRVEITLDALDPLLKSVDYVVTSDAAVAFRGLLFNRPAVMFGQADCHHILENTADVGVAAAFREVTVKRRPYAKYFYWFLQLNSINAGRRDAGERLLESCRLHGWKT
ncbi:MAG: hypothetical protein Q9M41_09335 [Paracoccaceae bacterium]|nr:hypothetical protein [Paracoccaceae bacterium]